MQDAVLADVHVRGDVDGGDVRVSACCGCLLEGKRRT